jgi:alkanesulfonate monooxygenase SsuD/methylene tetrahydromethanopterin reductase-like flavin-dependent oxidoreductase (luciferase family)
MADHEATSRPRPFRFGVVAPIQSDLPAWRDQVRRIADSGYSTLLMPDVQQWQPAPGPTLAVAATLAADLRVGAWVYASPLRAPSSVAWEAHSLSVLTEGRFEMGIGPGRPGMEGELRQLGLPVVTPGERLSQVRDAVTSLRDLDGPDRHTPVVVAVRGPKTWALAANLADTIIAAVPSGSRAETVQMASDSRAVRDVELALHVPVVGDAVSPFMAGPDTDPAALRAADSLLVLPGDPKAAIEEILRRREEGGFSYFVIGANAADALAPVVAELAGL